MKELYRIKVSSQSDAGSIIQGKNYRITVLTDRLLRMEYNEEGEFVDMPSQTVWFRKFPVISYEMVEDKDIIRIRTKNLQLEYKKDESFSAESLQIKMLAKNHMVLDCWHYGDSIHTLKGTVRTLDEVNGSTHLSEGVISQQGFALLEDSKSYLIHEKGDLKPRPKSHVDCYFLGYGHSYQACIRDFYQLTGLPPLLPRYALGNWWSRYHRYTDREYKQLVMTFEEKKIPLSVVVIDMDWHITEVEKEYVSGWTGYTWNKKLFPEPEEFLSWLHSKNLKITLNVHPAQGVRPYEECYEEIAKSLGYDVSEKETVVFDAADPEFIEAYLKYLHHPREAEGVDFWWIDWQQGETTKLPGLDPLWVLNHYHYLDNYKDKVRPMILSRYSDMGSHRYPIGFSGDSVISWESLAFQPYFTATASNVGYCWWSHDIGGHMMGTYSEELQIRWLQFGVFSPILRLHSSASPFNHKEPWNYTIETETIISQYMRLRHRLIPYLYSMNYRIHTKGIPLLRPMYYLYAEEKEAYQCPNEYFFGSEFIVHPVTSPVNEEVRVAKVNFWFPEDIYIDYFTGLIYQGKRRMNLYRDKRNIPVLMKAGAIVPLALEGDNRNDSSNPKTLEICVAAGADGEFALYEDDGLSMNYEQGCFAITRMRLDYRKAGEFLIEKPEGDMTVIPPDRTYQVRMKGFQNPGKLVIIRGKEQQELKYQYDSLKNEILTQTLLSGQESIRIKFLSGMRLAQNSVIEFCFQILDRAEIDFYKKELIYDWIQKESVESVLSSIQTLSVPADLYGAISEVLLAQNGKDTNKNE